MQRSIPIPISDLLNLKSSFQEAIKIIDKKLHDEEEKGAVSTAPSRKGKGSIKVDKAIERRMKRYTK